MVKLLLCWHVEVYPLVNACWWTQYAATLLEKTKNIDPLSAHGWTMVIGWETSELVLVTACLFAGWMLWVSSWLWLGLQKPSSCWGRWAWGFVPIIIQEPLFTSENYRVLGLRWFLVEQAERMNLTCLAGTLWSCQVFLTKHPVFPFQLGSIKLHFHTVKMSHLHYLKEDKREVQFPSLVKTRVFNQTAAGPPGTSYWWDCFSVQAVVWETWLSPFTTPP